MRSHHFSGKLCKLIQHVRTQPKNYAGEDIAFCPRDFPFIREDDVVEIYNPEEDSQRLLLKVTKGSLRDDFAHKDAISIEQSIASQFQLKNFPDVIINKIDVTSAELDSLELTFKDQYLGRSEMWRLKNSLINTCLYLNKRIEFATSTMRCQVYEMWNRGQIVSCGIVTSRTKIVFRSSSSMVYLFIQMSSEMWDFDIYGDLYFEKAVNGFLAELFARWKKNGSNHEVTIVLFSRLFYIAMSLEQFPETVRHCLQKDYKGRFYEDYYRVAVQNEKYDDWSNILTHLKHLFVEYQNSVLNAHGQDIRSKLPKSYISSSSQGNVLEVLNMSLNVFEKHYMDRSFDRTGQLSVIITPGVGVFEVDRELTNVTMQRIIDNGVGSDLVCVGEQPLHAVPLLKFHNKTTNQSNAEDYSMPHWINQSFYCSNKKVGYSTFVPRIKVPTASVKRMCHSKLKGWDSLSSSNETSFAIPRPKQNRLDTSWPNSVYDFDDYDAKVFQVPNVRVVQRKALQRKKTNTISEILLPKTFRRQNSEPEIYQAGTDPFTAMNSSLSSSGDKSSFQLPNTSTPAISIPSRKSPTSEHFYSSSFNSLNIEVKSKQNLTKSEKWWYDDYDAQSTKSHMSGSAVAGSPVQKATFLPGPTSDSRLPSRALINPFDPSHAVIKLTSNRRRWTHIFPRGPSGALIQQHHFHSAHPTLEIVHECVDPVESFKSEGPVRSSTKPNSVNKHGSEGKHGKSGKLTLLWGATGEQEWSCALQTGVDWKSLTIPACLPITTDYFPDERSLQIDFLVSDYNLLPDDVNADYAQQKAIYRTPLTTKEVFQELVSQRLSQGFQLIIRPNSKNKSEKHITKYSLNSSVSRSSTFTESEKEKQEYCLSIGRVFHKISLDGSTINVTRYRPRHAYPSIKIHYQYQFHAPNSRGYEASSVKFGTEKLENYNWNYLDHYICTRGDMDFILVDSLKYWRFRMVLLPSFQLPTKKVQDGGEHVNVYTPLTIDDKTTLVDSFAKFVEICVNRRIRRPNISGKKAPRTFGHVNVQGFRERLGSYKQDKTRIEKCSKSDGMGRSSPGENQGAERNLSGESTNEPSPQMSDVEHQLKADAAFSEILNCMRSSGFFFVKSEGLPKWTFISSDATMWLANNMEGVKCEMTATEKFNEMIHEGLICHASGNQKQPFVLGYYLYYIKPESGDEQKPFEDMGLFQNEWMEVKVDHDRASTEGDTLSSRGFLDKDISSESYPKESYSSKQVYIDVDLGRKSDRQEWGHLKYESTYRPDHASELVIQWVQATGSLITELVQSWSRKAQQCNMQLIPVPNDPFAFSSLTSDPLRGPIFIPFNAECLMGHKSHLFEGFDEGTWNTRMYLMLNAIVQEFGFIPMTATEPEHSSHTAKHHHHYIHSSGNIFLFFRPNILGQGIHYNNESQGRCQRSNESPAASSYDDYITHHVTGNSRDLLQQENKVGFFWAENYMSSSKRWKTSTTPALGDDSFVLKILKDFTGFCGNQNNRLTTFWENNLAKS